MCRILICALLAAPLPAASAPQESAPVIETQRVTAFDLLVELTRPKKPERSVAAPDDLAPDDFTLLWDGAPLQLVGLAAGGEDPEPWRLVVYIDRVLSSNHTVRWAAMELAERARRLTELGEVEIVVAEPEPRRALAPTRDRKLLDDSLSGVFLAPAGTAELVTRREDFLIAHPDRPRAATPSRTAADGERRLIRRQTDRLLEWLLQSPPPTSRRALLLVGDGWDLDPNDFYAVNAAAPGLGTEVAGLGRESRELAETLAAYGWIVAPLAPPAPPVGAGRFGAFVLPDVTFPWLFAVKLRSLEVWLDGNRKPKKARVLTELGNSLRAGGRLDEAVEAYKKAVYHYYDHPKTAIPQAAVLVALGETLELQEDETAARAAFRTATVFDPALRSRFPFADARLLAPHEPLETLAALTAGDLTTDAAGLDRMLTSLADRVRLTAQLPGTPDGELHRLELRLHRSGFEHRFAPVARWGTPPAVAALRLRRLLDGELEAGPLALAVTPVERSRREDGRLEVELRPAVSKSDPAATSERAPLVVSWASAAPETPIRYRLRTVTLPAAGTVRLALDPPEDHLWLALLVEDPAGNAWGGSTLELASD